MKRLLCWLFGHHNIFTLDPLHPLGDHYEVVCLRCRDRSSTRALGAGKLTASRPRHLSASSGLVEHADVENRLVSGVLIPYGEVGYATVDGAATAIRVPGPGRVILPTDDELHRVKMVDEHRDPPLSVGYAVAVRDTDTALRGQLFTSRTIDGDRVLAEMTADENGHRARDGFSVEMVDLVLTDTGEVDPATGLTIFDLESGRLHLVAAVVAPAWMNAREDGLAASRQTGRKHGMTEAQRARLAELLASTDRTDAENTELSNLLQLANDELPGDGDQGDGDQGDQGDGDQGDQGDGDQGDQGDGDQGDGQRASRAAASSRRPGRRAARAPGSLQNGNRRQSRHTIRDLAVATANCLGGRSRPEMEAALADITATANIWTAPDEYGGELWQGVEYQRRFVPLVLPGELRNYKGTGWKWVVRPEVADYAGDKAAVPSNSPTTESVEWTAARLAGAHDIDRKFSDFGDTEFIESYYHQMRESYAMKSDDKVRAGIIANAVATAGGSAGATIWHAAAKAGKAVFDATGGGLQPDYFLVNSADVMALVGTPSDQMPDSDVLQMFGVSPEKFQMASGVTAGTVVAGVRQALKFRELPGSPIRVDAINIANGGVDGGVFGYYALQEAFEGGIQSATFVAA